MRLEMTNEGDLRRNADAAFEYLNDKGCACGMQAYCTVHKAQ